MKIFTRLEHEWDEVLGRYRLSDYDCFEYSGAVALCTGVEEVAAPAVAGGKAAADTAAGVGLGAEAAGGIGAIDAGATFGAGEGFGALGGIGAMDSAGASLGADAAAGTFGGEGFGSGGIGGVDGGSTLGGEGAIGSEAAPIIPQAGDMASIAANTGALESGTSMPFQSALQAPEANAVATPSAMQAPGADLGAAQSGAPSIYTGSAPSPNEFVAPLADQTISPEALESMGSGSSTTTPPPGSGSVLKKALDKLGIGSEVIPMAGLALSAYQNMQNNASMKNALGGKSAQQAAAANAKQVGDISNKLLSDYKSGTLTASSAKQINDWESAQLAQTRQYYEKAGLANSSTSKEAEGKIHEQAVAMRDQALQNMLKSGLSASGSSSSNLNTLANQQLAQDVRLSNAMANFMQSTARNQVNTQGAPDKAQQ